MEVRSRLGSASERAGTRRTLTLVVRSAQVPSTPSTTAWPPSWPYVPTSSATRVTSLAKVVSCATIWREAKQWAAVSSLRLRPPACL